MTVRLRVGRSVGALLMVIVLGCGGSGGGGGPTAPPTPAPPPPPPTPTLGIIFTGDATPGPGTVFLEGIDTANLTSPFVLEIRANEVTDLYGISLDIDFPSDLLRWEETGTAAGDFLSESGAVEVRVLVDRAGKGHLIIGATRLGEVTGADGSGVLVSLEFENRRKAGMGDFVITMESAFDSTGEVLEDVTFVSGSIESKIG